MTATELVTIESSSTPAPAGSSLIFSSNVPAEIAQQAQAVATELVKVVEAQHLYTEIGNRRHVNVEGWTFCGGMLSVFPQTVWTRKTDDAWQIPERDARGNIVTPGRGGWEARVEVRTLAGEVVSAAESECRWEESKWSDADSYAVRSMAATRATSKALRQSLDWVMKLAGFASTPAEEMDGVRSGGGGSGPAEQTIAGQVPKCPACGSGVYDNRKGIAADGLTVEDADADKARKGPAWKCKNKSCTGGNEEYPIWSSFSTNPFSAGVIDKPDGVDEDDSLGLPPRRSWVVRSIAKYLEGDLDEARKTAERLLQYLDDPDQYDTEEDLPQDPASAIVRMAWLESETNKAGLDMDRLLADLELPWPIRAEDVDVINAKLDELTAS